MNKIFAILLSVILLIGCAAIAEEDGQNPVMNLIGYYQDETSERAGLEIAAVEDNSAYVAITWANSAEEYVVWEFIGEFDTATNTINYEDCVKQTCVYTDDETGETCEINYEDGTGCLIVNDDWSISWQDNVEDAGKDCRFIWLDGATLPDEEPAATFEDGQNPVMNIIGTYQDSVGQRATLSIDEDSMFGGIYTVEWADSAEVTTYWSFSGKLDTATNTVSYNDCVKAVVTYDENGEIVSSDVIYQDGTGTLTVNDDWTITWQDDVENAGSDCVFTFAADIAA